MFETVKLFAIACWLVEECASLDGVGSDQHNAAVVAEKQAADIVELITGCRPKFHDQGGFCLRAEWRTVEVEWDGGIYSYDANDFFGFERES